MTKPTILVVDDDDGTRRYLSALLTSSATTSRTPRPGEEALAHVAAPPRAPPLVLLDLLLARDRAASRSSTRLRQDQPGPPRDRPLHARRTIRTVVDAVRRGRLRLPHQALRGASELDLALQNVLEKRELREEVRILRGRLDQAERDLVSSNPRMLRMKEIARQVADTDAPVLILGESGVGKEVMARYIHGQSRRARQPFVKVNCAALPEDLLESELFGYERGAFSGALREKPGMFELADEGSILLDEIGEMSPQLQAKLLHVLQDGEFARLGGRQRMQRRRARPGRHQHPARGGGGGGPLPRGPLLPAQRHPHRHPAAARAARRHPACCAPTSCAPTPRATRARCGSCRGELRRRSSATTGRATSASSRTPSAAT